jgi:hypothetical protein
MAPSGWLNPVVPWGRSETPGQTLVETHGTRDLGKQAAWWDYLLPDRSTRSAAEAAGLSRRSLRQMLRTLCTGSGKTMSLLPTQLLWKMWEPERDSARTYSLDAAPNAGARRTTLPIAKCRSDVDLACLPGFFARPEFDADTYLRGGRDLPGAASYFALLAIPGVRNQIVWEPRRWPSAWSGEVVHIQSGPWMSPRVVVHRFVLWLITLWRRADSARFARALMLQLRGAGRLWADFRPAKPPGQLMMASGHVTRGPDVARMTQVLVICGEPLASM